MSNDTVGNDGIFLRASDRRRFDYVLRAVRDSSNSLALSSDNDGVLDHYGRLMLGKLRKTDGLQVEVFLPQNTEQLLERFNQILADLSLEDARRAEGSPAPRRVLIAHDAKAIGKRDLQLLARLVQDFPGANVSLVLLVDRAGMQLHERTLDGFGQRLLRWPVEAPTRTEGDALLKVARAMGFEVEVKKVLAATGYAEIKISPKPKKGQPAAVDSPQARFEAQLAAARKERHEQEEAEQHERRQRTEPTLDGPPATPPAKPFTDPPRTRGWLSKTLRWSAAIVLTLVVSATVVALLFAPKLPPTIVNSPILKENLPPWAMDAVVALVGKPPSAQHDAQKAAAPVMAATPAAATVSPPAVDSSNAKADSAPDAAPLAKADALPELAKSEPAKGEPAKAENVKAEGAKADAAKAEATTKADAAKAETTTKADAAKAVAVKAEASAKVETAKTVAAKAEATKPETPKAEPAKAQAKADPADALAPRSERGVDQLVQQARPGSFFVQHVSLGSMAEAQEWRAQYAVLARSRIAAVNTQDKGVKFAVISGPFATRNEASDFAARPGVPADPWLRPVKSLQAALLPAAR